MPSSPPPWASARRVGPVGAPEAHTSAPEAAVAAAPGYVLDVLDEQPAPGTATVAFRALGPDGTPVTEYTEDHGEDLHLVAVRSDLSGYQHVHPEMAADGTWTAPLTLTPGSWRLVADTIPAGTAGDLALTGDLQVAGDYEPQPLPDPGVRTEVDG